MNTATNTPRRRLAGASAPRLKVAAVAPDESVYGTYIQTLAPSGRGGIRSLLKRSVEILGRRADPAIFPWDQLNYSKVARVRAALIDQGYAISSVNMALSALKGIAQTAFNMRLLDADELARIKGVKRVKGVPEPKGRALSKQELKRLVDSAKGQAVKACAHRDIAMLLTATGAGLRASELTVLQLKDIDLQSGCITVTRGKGRKYREVYVAKPVVTALKRWLKYRGEHAGALFSRISKIGTVAVTGLSTAGFASILERMAESANVASFSPHDLRRTFITRLLEEGVDINTVRQLAGHADIATTARYDHRGEAVKQKASRGLGLF